MTQTPQGPGLSLPLSIVIARDWLKTRWLFEII
jgi:hypothetical protein